MEPELVNGNWIQTNAYILQAIKEILESGQTITVNPTPVTSPDVILEQNITLPRETQFISTGLNLIAPSDKPLTIVTNYITPSPKIVNVGPIEAYQRVCGDAYSVDGRYVNCRRCVDAWLAAHPDGFEIKYLTPSGTGCTTKIPKRCCKPNGMPF